MKVDINYVLHLRREMDKINTVPFEEIEWCDGDKNIDIDPRLIKDWKFIGMSNVSFIETGFYLEDPSATWEERVKATEALEAKDEWPGLGQPVIPKSSS